ncbi:MAG: diguanylate cyclase with sensor [Acidobacteriaceae bacterium]|nr:diguanylate cyclase with sensor [Acidobacteriaceae bacterium]
MILSSMDADTVLHQILLIVRNYFEVSDCAVLMVDAATHELYVRAENGHPRGSKARFKIGDGIVGHVASSMAPIYVPDVTKEPRYISSDPKTKSEFALPMLVRDEVIAVLDLQSDKVDFFTDDMIGLLAIFAAQAAVALENARLYSVERRRMRQIEFINLIARSATSANDLDQLLVTLCDLISDTFEGSEVSILIRDKDGPLSLNANTAGHHPDPESYRASARLGIIADALNARMNVLISNVPEHIREVPQWKPCLHNSQSEMAVPLLSLGETLGVIVISQTQPNAFNNDDRSIAQAAGDVCATAIKNVQLSEELRRVANIDSLTGVYNQRYFHIAVSHEISRAKRFEKQFAIMMFDLQNFRVVNQTHGFDAGDDLLRAVAHLLTCTIRSIDTVCRYSADRFALILPETSENDVLAVENKIINGLNKLAAARPGTTPITAAFGRVQYPANGSTELELVRHLLARIDRQKPQSSSAGAS